MAFTWFSPLTVFNANGLHKSSASALSAFYPGMLVRLVADPSDASEGLLEVINANTQKAFGIVIGSLQLEYSPLSKAVTAGKYTTVLQGDGLVQLTADCFDTVPVVGDLVYPTVDGSGKWTKTQSGAIPPVGRCEAIDSISAAENGSTGVYRVSVFNVPNDS